MEKKNFYKMALGIIILVSWVILLSGILHFPAIIWGLLVIITLLFYFGITRNRFRRRKAAPAVLDDMENYMERRAEKKLGKNENDDSLEEQDEKLDDFEDDIKIIKE